MLDNNLILQKQENSYIFKSEQGEKFQLDQIITYDNQFSIEIDIPKISSALLSEQVPVFS